MDSGTMVIFYKTKEDKLLHLYSKEEDIIFCNHIAGCFDIIGVSTSSLKDRRRFIDSFKASLKTVLLNNGNRFSPALMRHSTKIKEEPLAIKVVLKNLDYNAYQLIICIEQK